MIRKAAEQTFTGYRKYLTDCLHQTSGRLITKRLETVFPTSKIPNYSLFQNSAQTVKREKNRPLKICGSVSFKNTEELNKTAKRNN